MNRIDKNRLGRRRGRLLALAVILATVALAMMLALTSWAATPIVRGILQGDMDGRGNTISNAVFKGDGSGLTGLPAGGMTAAQVALQIASSNLLNAAQVGSQVSSSNYLTAAAVALQIAASNLVATGSAAVLGTVTVTNASQTNRITGKLVCNGATPSAYAFELGNGAIGCGAIVALGAIRAGAAQVINWNARASMWSDSTNQWTLATWASVPMLIVSNGNLTIPGNAVITNALTLPSRAAGPTFASVGLTNTGFIWASNSTPPTFYRAYFDASSNRVDTAF